MIFFKINETDSVVGQWIINQKIELELKKKLKTKYYELEEQLKKEFRYNQ